MEETKTAEEIYLDSLNLPITNSATRLFWEETLRVFKEQQLTQQQSANDELQEWKTEQIKLVTPFLELMHARPELKIGDSAHEKAIEFIKERDELKKQNEELVEMLQMHVYSLDFDGSEFHKKYGFNHAELFPRTRILLRKYTT